MSILVWSTADEDNVKPPLQRAIILGVMKKPCYGHGAMGMI